MTSRIKEPCQTFFASFPKPRKLMSKVASSSITSELLSMIQPYNYTDCISHLAMRDVLPQCSYPLTPLSQIYLMDTCRCYQMKRENPDQLYEIFTAMNEEDPINVRYDMISHIKHECNYYESFGKNNLNKTGLNIHQWLSLMESPSVYADELMLFALARTYQRHVVVFTRNKCWSTIGSDDFISGERLLEICDLKLVYISQHMFAELKQKPFIPITQTAITEASSYAHLQVNEDLHIPPAMDLRTLYKHVEGSVTPVSTPIPSSSPEKGYIQTDKHALSSEVSAQNAADKMSDTNQDPMHPDTDVSDLEQYLSPQNVDTSSSNSGEYPTSISNAMFESDYTSDSTNNPKRNLGLTTDIVTKAAIPTSLYIDDTVQCSNNKILGMNKVTTKIEKR